MTFIVHQVSRRATGGEIARTRTLSSAAPVVGRGTDCDIHLPDLTVDLRHARLSLDTNGLVLIEALGKLGFEVDGRFTNRAELDPDKGAVVHIGRYLLTFSRDATGDVRVAITGGAGPVAASTTANDAAMFSSPASVLSRRSLAWVLGLTVLLLCIAVPVTLFFTGGHRMIRADQQWNSGPLSQSHAFLQGDCKACHQKAFVAVRDDACLSCHGASSGDGAPLISHAAGGPLPSLIRAHASAHRLSAATPLPANLPGRVTVLIDRLVDHPNDRCASCHIEHVPLADGALPTERRAIPLLKTVNDCTDCHRSLKRRLPDTALGDTPNWARHPEFRPLVAVGGKTLRRVALSRSPSTVTGLIFSHRIHLLAAGGVARMAVELGRSRGYGEALDCGACHHADPAGGGFVPVRMEHDCRACHTIAFARTAAGVQTLPHGSVRTLVAFLRSSESDASRGTGAPAVDDQRRRPGTIDTPSAPPSRSTPIRSAGWSTRILHDAATPNGACGFCHKISAATARSPDFTVQSVPQLMRHLPAGGFDHGVVAHRQDALGRPICGQCHAASTTDAAGALLLPSIKSCAACHGARQATSPAASNCAECHDYHAPGRPRLTARDRQEIAAWRPSLIKVSQPSGVAPAR